MHFMTKPLYNAGEIDPNLIDLLFSLLDECPSNRPACINDIRQHPYLQNDSFTLEQFSEEMNSLYKNIRGE